MMRWKQGSWIKEHVNETDSHVYSAFKWKTNDYRKDRKVLAAIWNATCCITLVQVPQHNYELPNYVCSYFIHPLLKCDLLSRNQPVQSYGSTQHSDAPGTHGTSSCLTHEPSTANEYELRPSGEKERKLKGRQILAHTQWLTEVMSKRPVAGKFTL